MKLEPASPESVGMSARQLRHVEALAQRWVDDGDAGGIVMLVARRSKIVLQGSFGRRAPDVDEPPALDTLFPWGSASTLITITAAMALVDDGVLGLNRPVSYYLPEFRGPGKEKVMVHHLLTHTSGFRDEEVGFPGQVTAATRRAAGNPVDIPPHDDNQHPVIHEYLHATFDAPLNRPPGTEMSYGHYTMELVGEIVRRVTGKPLPEFAQQRLFEPLGMQDTTYTLPESEWHRLIRRPPDAPHAELMRSQEANTVPFACFSVYTSARDMAIFGQMFLNKGRYGDARVLSRAAVSEMTRNQVPGLSAQYRNEHIPEATWGIGWNVHGEKRALGEGSLQSPQAFYQGNAAGPIVWVDPAYELVGVYFSTALRLIEDEWPGDLFMNAVTAAVED